MKKRPSPVRWILMLLFCCPILAASQIRLAEGNELPSDALENDWFLKPVQMEIWHYKNGEWKQYTIDRCKDVYVCHDLLFLEILDRTRTLKAVTANGELCGPIGRKIQFLHCYDSIMVLEGSFESYYLDTKGAILAGDVNMIKQWELDTVQGIEGYCVPSMVYDSNGKALEGMDVRTWGFLGNNGKWLVPPIFDSFFRFYKGNGFAHVMYYGVKRKINEKGEFIE